MSKTQSHESPSLDGRPSEAFVCSSSFDAKPSLPAKPCCAVRYTQQTLHLSVVNPVAETPCRLFLPAFCVECAR